MYISYIRIVKCIGRKHCPSIIKRVLKHGKHGCRGSDHDTGLWVDDLQRMSKFVAELVDVRGCSCLELGPGNCMDFAYFMLLAGASSLIALDVQKLVTYDWQNEVEYKSLRDFVAREPNVLAAFAGNKSTENPRLAQNHLISRIVYAIYDGVNIPLPDGSVDFVYSNAVLEHVRQPEYLLRELARVLRSGGMMFHIIDLRDHAHCAPGVYGKAATTGDWLNFLRYSETLWNLMGEGTNRLRYPEWRMLFSKNGFRIEKEFLQRVPLHSCFDIRYVQKRWRSMSQSELSIAIAYVLASKT